MILTCPRCATRYVVGEDQVGLQGRKVKCAACGERWMVAAAPEPEPDVPEFEVAAGAGDYLATLQARKDKPGSRVALWGGLAALATVAVVAFVFQAEIEHQWPATARAYSAVGL
jgi:predicted Zn finger-like uncharacterized protein